MNYSSMAVLALAASVVVPPASAAIPRFGFHMHPHTLRDGRVEVTLHNNAKGFRDVKIDGHSYEILSQHTLRMKAPAGTVVYADSRTSQYGRGSVMLAVTAEMNGQVIELK